MRWRAPLPGILLVAMACATPPEDAAPERRAPDGAARPPAADVAEPPADPGPLPDVSPPLTPDAPTPDAASEVPDVSAGAERPPTRVCEPGAVMCVGTTRLQCTPAGDDWQAWPCPAQEACVDGVCLPLICNPGAQTCQGALLASCDKTGTKAVVGPCDPGHGCFEDKCVPLGGNVFLTIARSTQFAEWSATVVIDAKHTSTPGPITKALFEQAFCPHDPDAALPPFSTHGVAHELGRLITAGLQDQVSLHLMSRGTISAARSAEEYEFVPVLPPALSVDPDGQAHFCLSLTQYHPPGWADGLIGHWTGTHAWDLNGTEAPKYLERFHLAPRPWGPIESDDTTWTVADFFDFKDPVTPLPEPCPAKAIKNFPGPGSYQGRPIDQVCAGEQRYRIDNPEMPTDTGPFFGIGEYEYTGHAMFHAGELLRHFITNNGASCQSDSDCMAETSRCVDGACFDPLEACRPNIFILLTNGSYEWAKDFFFSGVQAKRLRWGLACTTDADCVAPAVCHAKECTPFPLDDLQGWYWPYDPKGANVLRDPSGALIHMTTHVGFIDDYSHGLIPAQGGEKTAILGGGIYVNTQSMPLDAMANALVTAVLDQVNTTVCNPPPE